ncbi:MAG TPA: hypothetical protein VGJ86_03935 [Acidimicrobiales bacterium]|jgi:uncharacterized cupredoxin-like copper-binding protein
MGNRALGIAGAVAVLSLVVVGCGSDGDDGANARDPSGSDRSGHDETASEAAILGDACDFDGESSQPQTTTSVQVTLNEYSMVVLPAEVPAGTTEFVANNEGTIEHEVAIIRFDGEPGALPLSIVDGVDESQLPDGAVVGRIKQFRAGQSCRAMFDLTPGRYALVCNVVDDGSNPHYSRGMYTGFTVT